LFGFRAHVNSEPHVSLEFIDTITRYILSSVGNDNPVAPSKDSHALGSDNDADNEAAQAAEVMHEEKAAPKMKVQTEDLQAQSIDREVVIQGQLEPAKVITLRAETSGVVRQISFNKGQRISRGQTLARLSEGNKAADLAVAEANHVQADNEYAAAKKLASQGLQSQLSLESASAAREAAHAQIQAAEIELAYLNIKAPLDALVEDIAIEEGDFIERSAAVATLVDNSSLLLTGRVSQQYIADIKTGQTATANLVTGEALQGRVSYISTMADDTTRSFEVEVLVSQTPQSIMTGISAEIIIPVETLMAHRVSPAVLALNDAGDLGVKTLGEGNTVVFQKIEVVKTESNGAWVTGLPNDITLITLGQGFVNPGEEVDPVPLTDTTSDEGSEVSDSQLNDQPQEAAAGTGDRDS